jgi:hypothetical protein
MCNQTPEWKDLPLYKFARSRHLTPAADSRTLVEIVWMTPGKAALSFRRTCAGLICRYFAGDTTLVPEIVSNAAGIDADKRNALMDGNRGKELKEAIAVREIRNLQLDEARTRMEISRVTIEMFDTLSKGASPDEMVQMQSSMRSVRRRLICGNDIAVDRDYAVDERVSVQMICAEMHRNGQIDKPPANVMMQKIGTKVATIFKDRSGTGEVTRMLHAGFSYKTFKGDGREKHIETVDAETAKKCRMRHSLAYGLTEVHARRNHDVWTYPTDFKNDIISIVREFHELESIDTL